MKDIDPSIFKAYDIRGIADENLSEEIVETIGKAFGTFLRRNGGRKMVVGQDIRKTSPAYTKALVRGLLSTGMDIMDMGIVITPALYYATVKYDVVGGAMVTASHNPAEYNGVKMTFEGKSLATENIMKVRDLAIAGDFEEGDGSYEKFPQANIDYYDEIVATAKIERKLKLVIDPSGASAAPFARDLFERLGCEVTVINEEVDPEFSAHEPDPVVFDNYPPLVAKMREVGADAGVMFDGDADRVGFVDEKGQIWLGDKIQMLLARDILPANQGRKVIIELKNSEAVVEEVKRLGGEPVFWKTGHTLIENYLHEVDAILAAEMSCHYYIPDKWYKFDDAMYAVARVLEIVAKSGQKFSELMEDLPYYPATPEYRVPVPKDRQLAIVDELVEYFKEKCDRYLDLDGIRGYIYGGWFLIRSSNTQPTVTIRIEGKDEESLEKIKKFVKDKIDQVDGIELDWDKQLG